MSIKRENSRITERSIFFALLFVYLILGFIYSITNPILESPDELLNYENIRFLAEQRRLPVLQPGEFSKAHHPPLYYVVGAAAFGWVPNEHLEALAENVNPFWGYKAYQVSVDNQSQYLRDPSLDGWPYRDAALGIHLMRWLSLLFGAVAITAVYRTARELVPKEPLIALGAAALVAFNPMFLFIQGSVHNDALTNMLAALTIWGVVHYWQQGPTVKRALFVGVVAGLGILTKITFLFLGPMIFIALVLRCWQDRQDDANWWQTMLKMLLTGGGIVAVLSGWWFVRNQMLYGEPTSMKIQSSIWQPRENAPDWQAAIADLAYLRDSFWGVFGWGQITLHRPIYTLMWVLALIALLGLIIWAVRTRRRDGEYRASGLLTAVLLIAPITAFGATFYRMSVSASADFGRYLFTTYAVIAPLYMLGMSEWFAQRWRAWVIGGFSLCMLGFGLYGYFGILKPAYAAPPLFTDAAHVDILHPLTIEYTDQAKLLGYQIEPDSAVSGEELNVTLIWEVLDGFAENHSMFVQLVDQNGDQIAGRDTHGGLGRYPTALWPSGQIVVDTIPVAIPDDVQSGATGLLLTMGMWDVNGRLLPTRDGFDTNTLGTVRLAAGEQPANHTGNYQLGDQVTLDDSDVVLDTAVPGEQLTFNLSWQALRQPDADYIVFMHLLDDAGNLVQAFDRPPQNGAFPTHLWQAGDVVNDPWQMQLPTDLAAGEYQLVTGWYRLDDLSRLPATDASGMSLPNAAIPLAPLKIEAAGE